MLIFTYVLTCVNGINQLSIWFIDVATYLQDLGFKHAQNSSKSLDNLKQILIFRGGVSQMSYILGQKCK
jgi:hypothetical protein